MGANNAKRIEVPDDICEGITSTNLEQFLRDFCVKTGISASPGYTFGRSGNVSANAWLLCDTVPSNKSGRPIFLFDAKLLSVFVMNEKNTDSFDLEIYEHQGLGSTYTLIHTTSFPGGVGFSDRILFENLDVPESLTTGKALGIKITNGSGKNVDAGLLISGKTIP